MKNKKVIMILATLSGVLSVIGMIPYFIWGYGLTYLAITALITSLLYLWNEKVNERQYLFGMPLSIVWLINGVLWTLTLIFETNI